MLWNSAVSEKPSFTNAIADVCDQALAARKSKSPSLALLFASPEHASAMYHAPDLIARRLNPQVLLGCTGADIIGRKPNSTEGPGVCLVTAFLGDSVEITPFEIQQQEVPSLDAPPDEWCSKFLTETETPTAFMLLPDPYTIDAEEVLLGMDYAFPSSHKFGGLVASDSKGDDQRLLIQGRARKSGMVGLTITGAISVNNVVSHATTPIGPQAIINQAERNVIYKLDNQDPVKFIGDIFDEAGASYPDISKYWLQIGFAADSLSTEHHKGDFLIRNVQGINSNGSITVGALAPEGHTVQFHTLDPELASKDLYASLKDHADAKGFKKNDMALLFSCITRRENLFGSNDHDAKAVRSVAPQIPLGGFFSNGQIASAINGDGRIESRLHGYTASLNILRSEKGSVNNTERTHPATKINTRKTSTRQRAPVISTASRTAKSKRSRVTRRTGP